MIRARRKTDIILLLWVVLAFVQNLISQITGFHYTASALYVGAVVFWMFSIRKKISVEYGRNHLLLGGMLIISLFVVRILRWDVFADGSVLSRLCWYAYYIPVVILPLITIHLSFRVGKRDHNIFRDIVLWAVGLLLIAIVLTNDFHGMLLSIYYEGGKEHSSAGLAYYLVMVWFVLLSLLAFLNLLRKSRIERSRRLWWIPLIFEGIGLILWGVYFANGASSPMIGQLSLYNIQEVYLIIFLGAWESYLSIGLIPSADLIQERDWIGEKVRRSVQDRIDEVETLYRELPEKEGEAFEQDLRRIACLQVSIKRRANLELITDAHGLLNTSELTFAIRETFEYFGLTGMSVGLEETGDADVPAFLVIGAYELFYDIINTSGCTACYVSIRVSAEEDSREFGMEISTDIKPAKLKPDTEQLLELSGAAVSFRKEDDTFYTEVNVTCAGERLSRDRRMSGFFQKTGADVGVAGLAEYLSLEKEVLDQKIRIHDGLGKSLLIIKSYLSDRESVDPSDIMKSWRELRTGEDCREQSDRKDRWSMEASALGLRLVTEGCPPEEEALRPVMDAAVTTHITNTKKHTSLETVHLIFTERKEGYEIYLTNHPVDTEKIDERMREGEFQYQNSGGLFHLKLQTERAGGRMTVIEKPVFCIKLILPKKEKQHVIQGMRGR